MTSRAATATIKGYYYQFDTTILKLLDIPDGGSIVVEGIEDIDIHTATEQSAVQCKYLSKPKFINSAVREPITLMLDHFLNPTSPSINYVLYAHFENEAGGIEKTIDIDVLKSILTYTEKKIIKSYHIDNKVTDAQLTSFLTKFKMIFGQEFTAQQNEVLKKLATYFACSEFEADTYFYNNALRIILDKAKAPNVIDRKISKADFKAIKDTKAKLFNEWYINLRSKDDYLKMVAKDLRDTKSMLPSLQKYIFIGAEILNHANLELSIVSMIENLVHKYYRMSYALRDSKPLTFILDCDDKFIRSTKKHLFDAGILYSDGHEEISFNVERFNDPPIINLTPAQKISKSSFYIRLIRKVTFEAFKEKITEPKVILHFSNETCPYLRCSPSPYRLFDIKYCQSLKETSTILN